MYGPLDPITPKTASHDLNGRSSAIPKTSTLAVTGMILGIFGLCFFPLGIAALILGIVALTQIADPARALTGRGMALAATILGGLSITLIPVALLIAILLPALGAARHAAQQMVNTTQVRQVVMAMDAYSQNNGGYYPGIDASSLPIELTVEGRYAEILDSNYITGNVLISPNETKTVWQSGPVTSDNYSYALLDISDPGPRRSGWSGYVNTQGAPVISDRNTGTSGAAHDVMSIHTGTPGDWAGSVGFNDGHASFENYHEVQTQYGSGQPHPNDNLFEMAGEDDAMMIYEGD